jgi:hypothetical protein
MIDAPKKVEMVAGPRPLVEVRESNPAIQIVCDPALTVMSISYVDVGGTE